MQIKKINFRDMLVAGNHIDCNLMILERMLQTLKLNVNKKVLYNKTMKCIRWDHCQDCSFQCLSLHVGKKSNRTVVDSTRDCCQNWNLIDMQHISSAGQILAMLFYRLRKKNLFWGLNQVFGTKFSFVLDAVYTMPKDGLVKANITRNNKTILDGFFVAI